MDGCRKHTASKPPAWPNPNPKLKLNLNLLLSCCEPPSLPPFCDQTIPPQLLALRFALTHYPNPLSCSACNRSILRNPTPIAMLARGVLCRLAAADVPETSTQAFPNLARFLHQSLRRRNFIPFAAARALGRSYKATGAQSRRSYATATTRRATKPSAAAAKKPAKTAATAKKTAPKTKAVAKKSTTRAAAKKATPKKRATKRAAKPKPKARRARKVLTPEEKLKARIRQLKIDALRMPVANRTLTAYNAFLGEKSKGVGVGETKTLWKTLSQDFKGLTPAEREHYNHVANERNSARAAEYKAWVHSHTPDQIRIANNARRMLTRLTSSKTYAHQIVDDRVPPRPCSAYIVFFRERVSSGDFKGIGGGSQAAQLVSKEWKALSAGEKQKYEDISKAEHARYNEQMKRASTTAS